MICDTRNGSNMWLNCVVLLSFIVVIQTSKILVFFPVPNTSHFKVCEGISLALANAGHTVTMVSAYEYPTNLSNLMVHVLTGAVERHAETKKGLVLDDLKSIGLKDLIAIIKSNEDTVQFDLSRPSVSQIMANSTFDLIIVELFGEQALLGLGQHFGAPMIAVSTFGASSWTNDLVGNPSPPSYVPHAFSSYPSKMNFLERMNNLLLDGAVKVLNRFYLYPGQVTIKLYSTISVLILYLV